MHGRPLRGPAPRRLGSRGPPGRPGPRRRRRRGHLPDRRHGALQPPRRRLQAGLLRRLQPLDRRVLRRRIPTACSAAGRRRCARPRRASPTSSAIKALGLRGVMMPGAARPSRRLRLAGLRRVLGGGDRARPAAVVPHPHDARPSDTRGPKMNAFLSIVRGCQDIMGMLVLGGVFERHPDLQVVCVEADAGWVPHFMYRMDHAYKRHRYWLPPGQELLEAAERVLRREHLRDVPGRLDGVPLRRRHELAPADVGQRLPAQRLDVAVVARRCSPSTPRTLTDEQQRGDPLRQRRRALRHRPGLAGEGSWPELWTIGVAGPNSMGASPNVSRPTGSTASPSSTRRT